MVASFVKYPDIIVTLVGRDGNGFTIIGKVAKAMRRHGVDKTEIDAFQKEAMDGDYDHLLRVVMRTVNVE